MISTAVMNLRDKYTLGQVISEGEVKTYAAREVDSDAGVLVHCLGAAKLDLMTSVVRRLRSAPLGGSIGILDMFESEGEVYLITEVIPGFSNLRAWLESESLGPAAQKPSSKPPQPERPQAEPKASEVGPGQNVPLSSPVFQSGDLTSAFRSPTVDPDAKTSAFASPFSPRAPAQEREQRSTPAMPGQVSPEPGEFTRIFNPSSVVRAQSAPQPPFSNPVSRPPAGSDLGSPPAVADTEAPGVTRSEFRPPAVAPPSGGQQSDSEPGEFTQLFRPSRGDQFIGGDPNALHPISDRDESLRQPGEFTQLFQPSFGDSTVAPEEPLTAGVEKLAKQAEPGVFTRIIQPNHDPDSQAPFGEGSLATDPIGTSRSAPEPGFDTLFGPVPRQDRLDRTGELSGEATFPGPFTKAAPPPDAPAANAVIPPERPAPPGYTSREAQLASEPILPASARRPPALPTPPVITPSTAIPKSPPVSQSPALPIRPKVPAPPNPPVARPPLPKAPAIKLPAKPNSPVVPPSPAGHKPGLSSLELALILGGLLLVAVAAVLLFLK